jgi:hypothetical protein
MHDGKQLTEKTFPKLLQKRAAVYDYLFGLWALCETKTGEPVLINSGDDEAQIQARWLLAPKLVGFTGFRKGGSDGQEVVADHFYKPWLKDAAALAKLQKVAASLESIAAIDLESATHRTIGIPDLMIRLLEHSSELEWVEFSLVLGSGRKVFANSEDLSLGLLKNDRPLGFAGLLLLGSRQFRLVWPVVPDAGTREKLEKVVDGIEEELRSQRPQPPQLGICLAADTIALLRGARD